MLTGKLRHSSSHRAKTARHQPFAPRDPFDNSDQLLARLESLRRPGALVKMEPGPIDRTPWRFWKNYG